MAYDPATGNMVLFGGIDGSDSVLNDTWTWNGTTWTEVFPATSPPARISASMAYDPATGNMVLFGGAGTSGDINDDTWTWNGSIWTQQHPATSPPARFTASMAYDPATGNMVLFGGLDGSDSVLNDTWTWNGTTWTEVFPATSPPARFTASMAYDPATGNIVLFGGLGSFGSDSALTDTWTWNGSTWTEQHPATSPSARSSASMAYDPATGDMVLFGGVSTSGYINDTWTWNGTTWTELFPATSPPSRITASMAYDPATGDMVLFGGFVGPDSALNDTWTLGLAITSANSATFQIEQPSSFTVTTYYTTVPSLTELGLLPNGVTFEDDGDGTATLAGTPELGTVGTYPFTITASDGVDSDVTQSFSLIINRMPQSVVFSSRNPSPVIVGGSSYRPTATGGPSTRPVLISQDTHSTGCTLTGGVVHFTAPGRCVLDANQAGDANYLAALQVQQIIAVGVAPSFTGPSSTTFSEGSYRTYTITATGKPTPTISETGTLPKGVKFVRGLLSGIPTQSGSFPITLTASNGFGQPPKEKFTLSVVNPHVAITSANTTTAIKDSYGSFTVKATGYPVPTFTKTGTLPSGVTLSSGGVLSGTPKVTGRFPITIKATNSTGTATQSFVLYVVPS